MIYREFRFTNFKGIEDVTISLEDSVTTLIGLNESGKTTILQALYCFDYGSEDMDALDPTIGSVHDTSQWIPISQRADFNDQVEIQATVSLDIHDQLGLRRHMSRAFDLTLSSVPKEIRVTEIYTFQSSRYRSVQATWALDISGKKGRERKSRTYVGKDPEWHEAVNYLKGRLPRIWYFPNFLFELPEKFLISEEDDVDQEDSENVDEADEQALFYRSIFENILRQVAPTATLESHIIERVRSSQRADARSLEALLLRMSEFMTKTVFEGWNRIFGRSDLAAQEILLEVEIGDNGQVYAGF